MKHIGLSLFWLTITGYQIYSFFTAQNTQMVFVAGFATFCGIALTYWELKAYHRKRRQS